MRKPSREALKISLPGHVQVGLVLLVVLPLVGCGKAAPTAANAAKGGGGKNSSAMPVAINLETGAKDIRRVSTSADGKRVAIRTSGSSKNIQVWDVEKKKKLGDFDDESGFTVALSPDGNTVAFSDAMGGIRVMEVATGKKLQEFSIPQCKALVFSPSGELLAGSGPQGVTCWNAKTGKKAFDYDDSRGVETTLSAFFDGSKKIATNGKEGGKVVSILDSESGKLLKDLPCGMFVSAIAVTPDGKRIAAATIDGIKVWDLLAAKEIKTVKEAHGREVLFLPDGKTLVYPNDNQIILENIDSGERRVLTGHKGDIGHGALALTPDGKFLVSGSDNDGTCKIWDLK